MDVFSIILNAFNGVLEIYVFCLFFAYFAERRCKGWLHYLFISLTILVLTAALIFSPPGILRMALVYTATILASLHFRLRWYNTLLLSTLVFSFAGISEFITTALISFIFSVDVQTATQGYFMILGIVLSKMLLVIVLSIMKVLKYSYSYSLTARRALTLLLIPLSTTVIAILNINLFVSFPEQSQTLIYSSLASYIVLIISNILIFHLIDNSYKEATKQARIQTVTELLQTQAKHYRQLNEHNHTVMKLRHDQKNFIIGLLSQLEGGDTEGAKLQLREQLDALKKPDEVDFSNIISAIVKTKSDSAAKQGVTIDFQYSELHHIKPSLVDIAIILGNALDNAIEATLKATAQSRVIHTIVKVNRDFIVIIIKNPTEKHVNTNSLVSTKRDGGIHGFGIASIEELTRKHGGEVLFKSEGLTFETNIILKNRNE